MKEWQADKFIRSVLQGLWRSWVPTEIETSIWMQLLKDAEYEPSCKAVRSWFMNSEDIGNRPLPGLLRHRLILLPEPGSKEPIDKFDLKTVERAFLSILTGPELRPSPLGGGRMVATKRWLEGFLTDHQDLIPGERDCSCLQG
jgi:hypothetical protein